MAEETERVRYQTTTTSADTGVMRVTSEVDEYDAGHSAALGKYVTLYLTREQAHNLFVTLGKLLKAHHEPVR